MAIVRSVNESSWNPSTRYGMKYSPESNQKYVASSPSSASALAPRPTAATESIAANAQETKLKYGKRDRIVITDQRTESSNASTASTGTAAPLSAAPRGDDIDAATASSIADPTPACNTSEAVESTSSSAALTRCCRCRIRDFGRVGPVNARFTRFTRFTRVARLTWVLGSGMMDSHGTTRVM
jgi:hypothetical protein